VLGIFLDTETNGLNITKHRTLEIALKIVDMLTGEQLYAFESLVALSEEEWKRGDPQSLKVNGFKWEEFQNAPPVSLVVSTIRHTFLEHGIERGKAVYICQNPSFDRAFFSQLIDPDLQEMLNWPYHWLDLASMYWALSLKNGNLPWDTGFTKDKIAKFLNLPSENHPHRAMNGVNHLMLCYEKIVGFPKVSV
jgi:hypothetical protein